MKIPLMVSLLIGVILATAGITWHDWQLYAILILAAINYHAGDAA